MFLGPGGYLASAGTLDDALAPFGAASAEEIYERLTPEAAVEAGRAFAETETEAEASEPTAETASTSALPPRLPGLVRQWAVLTRRTFETLVRNRLSLAILLGAPAWWLRCSPSCSAPARSTSTIRTPAPSP